jgi:hypothetical protein
MRTYVIRTMTTALLLSLPFATTHHATFASEPAGDSLTAVDVLLLPDSVMVDRAKSVNTLLRKNYPQGFALDDTHHPHITLLQCYVRTGELDKAYEAVGKVLDRLRPAGWQLEATGYYYLNFNGLGLAGIVIQPTADLVRLQEEIIAAVAPYTKQEGTAAAYVTSPQHPEINAPTLQYVNTFIPQRIGKNYNPHVTVGVGHLDYVHELQATPFDKFKFKVAGAAVYHLGDDGTAQKQLSKWKVVD